MWRTFPLPSWTKRFCRKTRHLSSTKRKSDLTWIPSLAIKRRLLACWLAPAAGSPCLCGSSTSKLDSDSPPLAIEPRGFWFCIADIKRPHSLPFNFQEPSVKTINETILMIMWMVTFLWFSNAVCVYVRFLPYQQSTRPKGKQRNSSKKRIHTTQRPLKELKWRDCFCLFLFLVFLCS